MTIENILALQATYYFPTALWALVHIKSFEKITGPKKDHWLVYTVALMLLCSSLVFYYSAIYSEQVPKETLILSASNCIALTVIDVVFSLRGTISKIYLLDALVEIAILISLFRIYY